MLFILKAIIYFSKMYRTAASYHNFLGEISLYFFPGVMFKIENHQCSFRHIIKNRVYTERREKWT